MIYFYELFTIVKMVLYYIPTYWTQKETYLEYYNGSFMIW